MLRFISIGNKMYEKQGDSFVICAVFKFSEDCEAVADSLNESSPVDFEHNPTDQADLARV